MFRDDFFYQSNGCLDDHKIGDSDRKSINPHMGFPLPRNNKKQRDVERQYENDRRPEPGVFPQVPPDFDSQQDRSQYNDNSQSHIILTQIHKDQKYGSQNGCNYETCVVCGLFLLGLIIFKHAIPSGPRLQA